jgi:rhamnosyltransferase subunit B
MVGLWGKTVHVLIEAVGSAGDVHPFLAIGQALQARGHEVDIVTSAYFAERVAQAGLGFIPVGTLEDYQRATSQPDLWHPRRAFAVIWRESKSQILSVYELLQRHIRAGETVLVGSTLAWSVRFAQEKLGVPAATVHLSPSCILSAEAPPRMPGIGSWFAHLPLSWRRVLLDWVDTRVLDGVVRDDLNAMRAQIVLAPVSRVFRQWQHSPQSVICAFPDWFCTPQADWPANSVTTGFPVWHAAQPQPLSAALEAFLAAGDAPIGFTPGSAMAFGKDFFERALAACEKLGRRAVFITPFDEQLPWPRGTAPAFVHHEHYAAFDALIPRLAAFVHHGGIGTTAQTMAAGVPQMITPFAHDQFDNAARIERLGCGAQVSAKASPKKWAHALAHLLGDAEVRTACQRVQALMADEAGVLERIVARIEALQPGAWR